MLHKNKGMMFIRCNKYQYMVRKGSMSNYSFNILDEEKDGFIDFVFEKIEYPIEKVKLVERIGEKISIPEEEINKRIDELIDLDVLLEKQENTEIKKACLFFNEEISNDVQNFFCEKNPQFSFSHFVLQNQSVYSGYQDSQIEKSIIESEIVIAIVSYFSPNVFYELNTKCIEHNKALFIAYLDGDEGVIVPLNSPSELSCYNDFELLRESSFYNLLDYQVMKEDLYKSELEIPQHSELCLNALLVNTTLIIREILSHSKINQYAYSFDFERMINTKVRLMKFPNCPSCQGDLNIAHPFI